MGIANHHKYHTFRHEGVKQDFPSFDFMNRIGKDSLLCDLIYSPARTSFLIEGEREDLPLGGIHMLIEGLWKRIACI